jgi:alkylation response protein AidB-like acyl-CoA dehydrogenase
MATPLFCLSASDRRAGHSAQDSRNGTPCRVNACVPRADRVSDEQRSTCVDFIRVVTRLKEEQVEGRLLAGPIALAKVQATKVMEFCAREASQILGGNSYLRGTIILVHCRQSHKGGAETQNNPSRWYRRESGALVP